MPGFLKVLDPLDYCAQHVSTRYTLTLQSRSELPLKGETGIGPSWLFFRALHKDTGPSAWAPAGGKRAAPLPCPAQGRLLRLALRIESV